MSDYEPIDINWSAADLKDGLREGTVTKIETHSPHTGAPLRSQKDGSPFIMVHFSMTDTGETIRDVVMLGGPGARMGLGKLQRLGVEKGQKFVPADIIGRRVMLVCKIGQNKRDGSDQIQVARYEPVEHGSETLDYGDKPAQKRPPDGGDTPF